MFFILHFFVFSKHKISLNDRTPATNILAHIKNNFQSYDEMDRQDIFLELMVDSC